MSEDDWLKAKVNYDKLKHDVQAVHVQHNAQKQQQVQAIRERRQPHLDLRNEFLERVDTINASKVEMLQALTSARTQRELLSSAPDNEVPFAPSPKPQMTSKKKKDQEPEITFQPTPRPKPKSSYEWMMQELEGLVPSQRPAPRPDVIRKVHSELEVVVPKEQKNELQDLIGAVKPWQIMPQDQRLGWLYRAKKFIPDIPVPESDLTLTPPKKY